MWKEGNIIMRKYLSLAAGAAMFVSVMPFAAQAFPISAAPTAGDQSQITLVAGGCGVGFHRGPYGGCQPNRGFVRRGPVVCRIVGLIPHRVCRVW